MTRCLGSEAVDADPNIMLGEGRVAEPWEEEEEGEEGGGGREEERKGEED